MMQMALDRFDDLVPPPVARYILEHHLYGKVGELNDEDGHD